MASTSSGRLLVCATPIGNLGDVTLRVLDALKSADAVAAEDTRVTRKLFARYDISTSLERCDEHTVERQAPLLVARMLRGEVVAFVSDAGTPGVSDPGARLIAAAVAAGVPVEALPGASALLTALVVSGLPMRRFYFGGFLPRKAGERRRELESLAKLDATLAFFESPRRTAATLSALAEVFPGRQAALARELTKMHEEVVRGSIEEVADGIAARESLKGEVVLLVGPPAAEAKEAPPDPEVVRSARRDADDSGNDAQRRSQAGGQGVGCVTNRGLRHGTQIRAGAQLALANHRNAVGADWSALDVHNLDIGRAAYCARILVFGQDDPVAFDEYRHRVLHLDAERATKLHRNDDSAEVINPANDAGVVHRQPPLQKTWQICGPVNG